jgi:putative transposase
MMYVRFPLSLRNVEDLLHERGIEISHETVRFWWLRFGPMFAAEIRKRRVSGMRASRWRWHLDEVFVKVNGVQHYLWRAVDHEGEVLEAFVSKTRDKACSPEVPAKADEAAWPGRGVRNRWAQVLRGCPQGDRGRGQAGYRSVGEQPGRELPPALPKARKSDAPLSSIAKSAEVRCRPLLSHNLFNSDRSLSSRPVYKMNRAAALAEWRGLCAN